MHEFSEMSKASGVVYYHFGYMGAMSTPVTFWQRQIDLDLPMV
jgi:hypothetical protein